MSYRISDAIGRKVASAIDSIPVLAVIRDEVGWEITPALIPDGDGMTLAYMVAVSLPLDPGSAENDHVLYMTPLSDPDASQGTVNTLVYGLYQRCQAEADQRRAAPAGRLNGHGKTPGGLIVP